MDLLLTSSDLCEKVKTNTQRFREQMTKAGFTLSGKDHPISPVMLGDAKLAADFADEMLGNIYNFELHLCIHKMHSLLQKKKSLVVTL